MSVLRRREMAETSNPKLSIVRQCGLLGISRSGRCCQPAGASAPSLLLKPVADAADRRGLSRLPLLRSAPDDAALAFAGAQGWAAPCRPPNAENGSGGDLAKAQHQQARQGTQDLSVSSQGSGDHKAQSEPALAKARVWRMDIILGSSPRTGSISRWPRASCIWRR